MRAYFYADTKPLTAMKTILVPTDFSETAANALRYAVELSGSLLEPLDLVLLHVYEPVELPAGTPSDLAAKETARQEEEVLEKLKSHARKYCRHSGIRHTRVAAMRGMLSTAITQAAAHFEADLVVMGTKGVSGINAFLLNSNTAELGGARQLSGAGGATADRVHAHREDCLRGRSFPL